MIAAILSLLGSSAFGSAIGGLLAFLNRKTDLEAKRLDHQLERDRWAADIAKRDKDIEYARTEAQGAKEVAIVEGDSRVEAARMAAIAAAQAADALSPEELNAAGNWRWVLVLADAVRRFIRPAATVALTAAALWLSVTLILMLRADGWSAFNAQQKIDLGQMALNWVFCQAGAALTYWFVARGTTK